VKRLVVVGLDDGDPVEGCLVGDPVATRVSCSIVDDDVDDADTISSTFMATPQVTIPYGEPGRGGDVSRMHLSSSGMDAKSSQVDENPNTLPADLPLIRLE
jgi:hypothetical protein